MTEHRSFKRLVRARMAKTGESYTTARAMLLRAEAPTGATGLRLATSDEKIRQRTGHGWEEWFGILDEWGAADRTHREIARWVAAQLAIEPLAWNAQAITASYELTRGLRAIGEKEDGFAITASRTVGVPVERLYDAFVNKPLRRRWLPDAELSPRTINRPKSARFDWGDGGTRVNVTFLAKGSGQVHSRARTPPSCRRRRGRPDEGLLASAARRSQGGTGAISAPTNDRQQENAGAEHEPT